MIVFLQQYCCCFTIHCWELFLYCM